MTPTQENREERAFTEALMDWNARQNRRSMPWKGEKDPYRVWLSEVILQQTRVEQGKGYYERFLAAFPTVRDLAEAQDSLVFKLWEGLGYYNRCKNLLASARRIEAEWHGQFPRTYEEILDLRGVGSYTAAAIASFAFGLPHPVVDGNVLRVLSRFFGVRTPVDTPKGKAELGRLAENCLDRSDPAAYNQALMDFGATVCKPAAPACTSCPLARHCIARREGLTTELPLKSKGLVRKERYFLFVVATYRGSVYIRKRTTRDIWENLHEFLNVEGDARLIVAPQRSVDQLFAGLSYTITSVSGEYKQLLTHQKVHARFVSVRLDHPWTDSKQGSSDEHWTAVPLHKLREYAFPKLANAFLDAEGVAVLRKN